MVIGVYCQVIDFDIPMLHSVSRPSRKQVKMKLFGQVLRRYRQILSFACLAIFLVQFGHLLSGYIHPTELNTVMEIVKKNQLEEFPLLFQFCLRPGFNTTVLKSHGFQKVDDYFWGVKITKSYTDVEWGGENGSLTPEGL